MSEFLAILVPALGHALLDFLWQGAIIGLLAALALHSLRHARPQARYAVACFALLACVLVPLVSLIAQLATTTSAPLYAGTFAPLPGIAEGLRTPSMLLGLTTSAVQLDALLPWIVASWAAGASVLSLRVSLGLMWIHRLRQSACSPIQATWQLRLDALAVHFDLRRRVALRLVDNLDSPVSAGWWRPIVLLPTALITRMPTYLIEALLAHELAHIRRHDYLINLLQNAVEALLFYHPVIWWLSNRIRIERELIADQVAAEVACTPRHLAVALSELSGLRGSRHFPQLTQAARGGKLLARIERLVRPTGDFHPGARIVFPLLGLLAAGIASYSYAQVGEPDSDAIGSTFTHSTEVDHTRAGSPRETIALVSKGDSNIRIWGPNDDLPAIEAAKRGTDGDLLWIYRAGKDYVVIDPSLLDRARQAWHQAEALSQQIEALNEQLQVHSSKADVLGKRMEMLSAAQDPSPEARAAMHTIDDMERQQQLFAREELRLTNLHRSARGDSALQQRTEAQMAALAIKQDELVRRYEQQLDAETKRTEAQQQPMQALMREMEIANGPMEALSKQLYALERQQQKASEQTERELRKVIKEALSGNYARPVPMQIAAQ